jgi:hypothetical protein
LSGDRSIIQRREFLAQRGVDGREQFDSGGPRGRLDCYHAAQSASQKKRADD